MVGKKAIARRNYAIPATHPHKHKYGASGVTIDGHYFPSKAEGRRYTELKQLQALGEISALALQPRYPFYIEGKLMFTYVADFRYYDNGLQEEVVEDVKGMLTPMYKLKKKMVEAVYKIKITEI